MKNSLLKLFSVSVALTLTLSAFTGCSKKPDNGVSGNDSLNNVQNTEQISQYKNPLTGEKGYDEKYLSSRPVAVMVENTPDARPQWGLCSPDIVFETEVEGGITRMMWVYANESELPDKIGPVRSTRNAYAELALGLDAILFHIGASDIAYRDYINNGILTDIDGMAESFFSRDYSRNVATEHTAYTTKNDVISAINKHISSTAVSQENANPFNFTETGATAAGTPCIGVTAFFSDYYVHTFTFDESDGLYHNYMNSAPMTDEYDRQMCVKNVLVLFADMVDLGDAKGHVDVDLSSGHGYYLSEGKVLDVVWEKGYYSNLLKIYDRNGSEISLNEGKSWIGFVRSGYEQNSYLSYAAN